MDLTVTQNFLNNQSLVEQLVRKSNLRNQDTVYDLGAGKGIISLELSKVAGKVISVEYDINLFKDLTDVFKDIPNVVLKYANILDFDITEKPYKVFSNIPFNITSRIVNKIFLGNNTPESAYIIMQKEAAKRFLGEGEGYLISKLLQVSYDLEIFYEFKKSDFTPAPGVDIVMLAFKKNYKNNIKDTEMPIYRDFTSYVYLQQKPNLKTRLSDIFSYKQITHLYKRYGFSAKTPASEININTWVGIFQSFLEFVPQDKKNIVVGSYNKYKQSIANAPLGSRTKSRIMK